MRVRVLGKKLLILIESLSVEWTASHKSGWLLQDVAVKVFLEQDLKVEALEEFKMEVSCFAPVI